MPLSFRLYSPYLKMYIGYMQMMLTQKNRLKLPEPEMEIVRLLSFYSARLYNVGLYSVRQYFFDNNEYLNYSKNYHQCKDNENYRLLLSDTAQQILRLVERNFKSFFGLLNLKQRGKYSEKVRLPHYKKANELGIITIQGRSARIRNGYVLAGFSKGFKEKHQPKNKELKFKLPKNVEVEKLQELRIIPKFNGREFDIEFVYKKEIEPIKLNADKYLSCDLGLDNFATLFDSTDGSSFIIDGKKIKSINQRYNKETARLQSIKDHQKITKPTKRMINLNRSREFKINDYFNRGVKHVTDYCLNNDIGNIIVGNFEGIKQGINHGRRNNQNFVQIPYGIFRRKLKSKCEQLGIELHSIEESYTSKTSFLDCELPEKHDKYLGKRVKRGLFCSGNGTLINADTNGAAQILVKYFLKSNLNPDLFRGQAKGAVNAPLRVKLC